MEKAEHMTEGGSAMIAIIAIGYGGQEEIARAIRSLAMTDVDMTSVTQKDILVHLETARFPPPDLIIRTG
jgi:undecaprenyl diphosphate synthase